MAIERRSRSEITKSIWRDRDDLRASASERMVKNMKDPAYKTLVVESSRIANTGKVRSRESRQKESERQGGIKYTALPLLLRGASAEEVSGILQADRRQVKYLIDRLRKKGELRKPTKEEESKTKRKAHLGKPRNSHDKIYSVEEQNAFAFAREFFFKGFFTTDLSSWEEFNKRYKQEKRDLPGDFTDKLRLEVFFRACNMAKKGDRKLLAMYNDLGRKIDPQWFLKLADEEDFILDSADKLKHSLPKKLEDYPCRLQVFIEMIDEQEEISIESKKTFFVLLVQYVTERGIDYVAQKIGISREEAIREAHKPLTDSGWELLKTFINKIHQFNY